MIETPKHLKIPESIELLSAAFPTVGLLFFQVRMLVFKIWPVREPSNGSSECLYTSHVRELRG